MVYRLGPNLDRTFAALADPVRRAVLDRLRDGDQGVSALATAHAISLPAFMKHVRTLERAGLMTTLKTGRVRTCRLCDAGLAAAETWLRTHRAFWEGQLDSLERLFQPSSTETHAWPAPLPPRNRSKSGVTSRRRRLASTTPGRRRSS